jgi:hypothetical protein
MSILFRKLFTLWPLLGLLTSASVLASTEDQPQSKCDKSQYTFSWSLNQECDLTPRGGTTAGADIKLDHSENKAWRAIQEKDISDFEKDRRAILAMAGAYRVSFDFLEVVGFTTGYSPSRPYQSWGTEYVYVAEDEPNFISLQHIMVMYFKQEDGSVSEPMVMKHWRQDWQFEKPTEFVFTGNNIWERRALASSEVKGMWSQSVFQVDDSPRYESRGKWEHYANFSSWKSGKTWRPLPRREGSVRKDYHVLEGFNRHTITPSGWVQEEENMKLVLDQSGEPHSETPYLAKEIGVARYERVSDHDFKPGDIYWEKTGPFWRDVREVWSQLIAKNSSMSISKKGDGQFMFMPFFQRAQEIADGASYDSQTEQKRIREMLSPFLKF